MIKKSFFLLAFILCCCESPNRQMPVDDPMLKANIEEFKRVFFESCLARGSKRKLLRIFDNDISTSSDFRLGIYRYRAIDSIALRVNKQITLDSIARHKRMCFDCDSSELNRMREEGYIGHMTLKFCLDYYNSHELDSIAKSMFPKVKTSE